MDLEDAEVLRRRLYAPEASAADVTAYLDRAGARPTPSTGPRSSAPVPRRRTRRGPLAVVMAGSVLVLAAGAVATGATAARSVPAPVVRVAAAPAPGHATIEAGVVDGGARDDAGGTASPATATDTVYATASGDTAAGIAGRFGLCVADVLIALPYGFDPGRLPSDQHLLLHHGVGTAPRTGASGGC